MAEHGAILDLFLSLKARLARAVLGIVPPKEVEDIVQETYVRIFQLQSIAEIRQPQALMFRTALNLALDHARRAESRLATSIEESGDFELSRPDRTPDTTFDQAVSAEEFTRFCEAVRQLPLQCRRAFILKKVYGYSQAEIAKEMRISESTVEKHIAQGIKRCAQYLFGDAVPPRRRGREGVEGSATAGRRGEEAQG